MSDKMSQEKFTELIKALPGAAFNSVDGWGIKPDELDGQHGQLYMVDGHRKDAEGKREPWSMATFVPEGAEAEDTVKLMLQRIVTKEID